MIVHSKENLWIRFKEYQFVDPKTGFRFDISRVNFPDSLFKDHSERINSAYHSMELLEKGAIANPDEKRMVGHYWLRDSKLAPTAEIKNQIDKSIESIKEFSNDILSGKIKGSTGIKFESMLIIGIGGSALGPQFVANALGSANDAIKPYFIDNTDPEGIERTISSIPNLSATLVVVISKSGGTPEPRNGMIEAKVRFESVNLSFNKHAVAVTGDGSALDKTAVTEKWLARFPMWDWVGGRTSEVSAVGLLPAALQGFDIDGLLNGAKEMDILTRNKDPKQNPAMLLSLMWYFLGDGKGTKAMVVLPYRDRLELLSRYLQQLVMESVGKEKDLDGKVVNQGLAVYGNKGSTDQHAYVQQLRDGLNNFFAVFVEADRDTLNSKKAVEVEPGVTSSDYLHGFLLGTRQALYENGRQSITISISKVDAFNVGMLIALFERAVGFYASMINVNAYHQPGVEAGKKAASSILEAQRKILDFLNIKEAGMGAEEIAKGISEDPETVMKLACHLVNTERLGFTKGANGEQIFSLKGN